MGLALCMSEQCLGERLLSVGHTLRLDHALGCARHWAGACMPSLTPILMAPLPGKRGHPPFIDGEAEAQRGQCPTQGHTARLACQVPKPGLWGLQGPGP